MACEGEGIEVDRMPHVQTRYFEGAGFYFNFYIHIFNNTC